MSSKKKSIPKVIKTLSWNTHIGENIGKTKCLCCRVTDITQSTFHAGHVISENNGGKATVDNIKPICQPCNNSMGTKNMNDFIKDHGLDKDYNDTDKIILNLQIYLEKLKEELVIEKSEKDKAIEELKKIVDKYNELFLLNKKVIEEYKENKENKEKLNCVGIEYYNNNTEKYNKCKYYNYGCKRVNESYLGRSKSKFCWFHFGGRNL